MPSTQKLRDLLGCPCWVRLPIGIMEAGEGAGVENKKPGIYKATLLPIRLAFSGHSEAGTWPFPDSTALPGLWKSSKACPFSHTTELAVPSIQTKYRYFYCYYSTKEVIQGWVISNPGKSRSTRWFWSCLKAQVNAYIYPATYYNGSIKPFPIVKKELAFMQKCSNQPSCGISRPADTETLSSVTWLPPKGAGTGTCDGHIQ